MGSGPFFCPCLRGVCLASRPEPRVNTAIAEQRLHNQCITNAEHRQPADVVEWLGAVQAQEYPAARWGLGLRMPEGASDNEIERAFDEGKILRTHVMRPDLALRDAGRHPLDAGAHGAARASRPGLVPAAGMGWTRPCSRARPRHSNGRSGMASLCHVPSLAQSSGARALCRKAFRSRSSRSTPSSRVSSAAALAAGSSSRTPCWRIARQEPGACHATRHSPSSQGGTSQAMARRRSGTSCGGRGS